MVTAHLQIAEMRSLCDHCGNITDKARVGLCESEPEDGVFIIHELYECRICGQTVLLRGTRRLPKDYQGSIDYRARFAAAETVAREQLWPPPLGLPSGVPTRIQEIYQEARLVRRSPSSFVVQIGRALQAVTSDKGAQGRSLDERLGWLVGQGLLPPVLGELADINRIFRNWGAHDAATDVEPEDAEIAEEFFRAIIDYLYIAPAKVERVRELISRR